MTSKSTPKSIYDAILFDVGDTLLIHDPPGYEVLMERCREVGLSISQATAKRACKQSESWLGEQILREMQGAPRMPDAELHLNLDLIALQNALSDKTEDEIRHLAVRLQAIPQRKRTWALAGGVHETLAELREMGLTLGIVSNFDETLLDLCDRFGLTPHFDTIVASGIVGVEKPDPEILRIACRRLGVDVSASLYVGDHPFDVLCAKDAGMSVAWTCEPLDMLPECIPYQPDYRIPSVADIGTALGTEGESK